MNDSNRFMGIHELNLHGDATPEATTINAVGSELQETIDGLRKNAKETFGWSGSAFVAGEKVDDPEQHMADLYNWLCGLGNSQYWYADRAEVAAAKIASLTSALAEKTVVADLIEELTAAATCAMPPPGFPETRYEARLRKAVAAIAAHSAAPRAKPLDDWIEDYGDVVWWTLRDGEWLGEPAYIGTPLDLGFGVPVSVGDNEFVATVGGWPGYHTHWTPHPALPAPPAAAIRSLQEPAGETRPLQSESGYMGTEF